MLLRHAVSEVRKLVFHLVLYLLFISVRMIMEKFFTREEDGFLFYFRSYSEVKYFLVSSSLSLVNCTLFCFCTCTRHLVTWRQLLRWLFVWLSRFVQCFHCSESAGIHMPNYFFMMLAVCVYWVRQLSGDEVRFSLPTLQPHSCWSNLSHLCRRGSTETMFFFPTAWM